MYVQRKLLKDTIDLFKDCIKIFKKFNFTPPKIVKISQKMMKIF